MHLNLCSVSLGLTVSGASYLALAGTSLGQGSRALVIGSGVSYGMLESAGLHRVRFGECDSRFIGNKYRLINDIGINSEEPQKSTTKQKRILLGAVQGCN